MEAPTAASGTEGKGKFMGVFDARYSCVWCVFGVRVRVRYHYFGLRV